MASQDPGFKYILYLHLSVCKGVTSSCCGHWIFKFGSRNIDVNDKHSTHSTTESATVMSAANLGHKFLSRPAQKF